MFAIIGILVVFGAVIGGFLMEKGHMAVLLQPAELLIIAGASAGTLLVANPIHILKEIVAGLVGVLHASKFGKERYLNTLKMMYQFLNKVRKEGLLSVEMDVEKPEESTIFKNYPDFLNDHHARDFVCDTLRMAITGGVEPFDMDQMMELDMEVHHHDATQPVNVSSNMAKTADEHNGYLHVLRVLLLSFLKGSAPMIAIEVGRRAIPAHVRPSFDEMEKRCKNTQAPEAVAA
jgi:chemotaxis protein MotA